MKDEMQRRGAAPRRREAGRAFQNERGGIRRQFRIDQKSRGPVIVPAEPYEMDRVELRIIAMRQPLRIAGNRGDIAGKHHVGVREPYEGLAG